MFAGPGWPLCIQLAFAAPLTLILGLHVDHGISVNCPTGLEQAGSEAAIASFPGNFGSSVLRIHMDLEWTLVGLGRLTLAILYHLWCRCCPCGNGSSLRPG